MKSETNSSNGALPSGAEVTTALPRPQIAPRQGTATLKTGLMARTFLHQGLGGLLIFLVTGCDKPIPTPTPPPKMNATERVFATRGVVRSVPDSGLTLVVRHEEIPGYMPKMTMALNVRDTNELRGVEREDEITFQLVATADAHWIQNLKRVGKATPAAARASLPPGIQLAKELAAGDALPDYELLAPQGRIHQQFDGNQWMPEALAESLLAAAELPVAAPAVAPTNHAPQRIEIPGVQNAFRATERIYSGSQPEGNAAFAALAKLGVKTLISVDGSQPDVEAARKYGLRYIHLPFGYDGVPTNRVAELAQAMTRAAGPFFVHCHHGNHRGPTAVAVMCLAGEGWTPDRAVTWLHAAGTAEDYAGLYRAAREFQAPTAAQLAAVTELPEIARTSSLVEAMVAIDAHLDHLKLSQKAGWKTPPGHADISPTHEATMLWEQFREIARTDDAANRTEDYRITLTAAEHATDSLRKLLREPTDAVAIDAAFQSAGQSCAGCHRKYRNK